MSEWGISAIWEFRLTLTCLKFICTTSWADVDDAGKWRCCFKKTVYHPPSSLLALIPVLWITGRACSLRCFSLYQSPTALSVHLSHGLTLQNLWDQWMLSGGRGAIDSPPLPVHPSSLWPFIDLLTLPFKHTHTHIYPPLFTLIFIHLYIPLVIIHPYPTLSLLSPSLCIIRRVNHPFIPTSTPSTPRPPPLLE